DPHPLTPLSADEIRAATRIFRASGRLPRNPRFSFLALDEPPKELVVRGAPVPRRAFAIVYDRAANLTFEAVADLSANRLASWKAVPGARPPVGEADSVAADRIVRADSRWRAALEARGLNSNAVYTVGWPAGYFALPGEDGGRIVRVTPFLGSG